MKFTDGFWQLRPGSPRCTRRRRTTSEQTDADDPDGAGLVVTAPTAVIAKRGDVLNRPTLTVTLVVAAGGRRARAHRAPHRRRVARRFRPARRRRGGARRGIRRRERRASSTTGPLAARIAPGAPWNLSFEVDGTRVTGSGPQGAGATCMSPTRPRSTHGVVGNARSGRRGPHAHTFVHEQLDLGVGELIYGLGERFGPLVKNGQSIDIWNADGGTSSEQAYKNVPFYLSNRGYGVLVNDPGHVSYEIGSEAVERVQFSVPGEVLEYFVIAGPTPKQVLDRYTALTGRPPIVPAWSYGLWLSTSFTTDYDEATVTSFVDEMARRELPVSVFHFDCFWMREFNWCDFEWDPRVVPRPGRHARPPAGEGPAGVRLDQPLHRPALAAVRRGRRAGFPREAPRRLGVAMGPLAGGNGARRLHQPRRDRLVPGQAPCARRPGGGLLQDRLR